MRRVLIALTMVAASAFMAAPAIADDVTADAAKPSPSSGGTPGETPSPAEDVPESPSGPEDPGTAPESKAKTPAASDDVVTQAAKQKVTICHSTSADNNPYVKQKPNANGDVSGHADHDGGVFPDDPWGDIIPPFEFDGGSFPGQNWTAAGQAIYFNDCKVPGDEPPPNEQNIKICHATGSQNMPYSTPNPSVDGILNGHADHTGPVFSPGATEWGDIIPPFDFGPGAQFDGLNWTAEGQAIYFNDCNADVPDDDDECEDDCGDDHEDGDDRDKKKAAALPDTGGPSPWVPVMGTLLTVLGTAVIGLGGLMGRKPAPVMGRHVRA